MNLNLNELANIIGEKMTGQAFADACTQFGPKPRAELVVVATIGVLLGRIERLEEKVLELQRVNEK